MPAEILPLSKKEEIEIVRTLLTELNEKFCVSLDANPPLTKVAKVADENRAHGH
jgi:hypothetical protein